MKANQIMEVNGRDFSTLSRFLLNEMNITVDASELNSSVHVQEITSIDNLEIQKVSLLIVCQDIEK